LRGKFTLTVPSSGLDKDNDYRLYIKAYEDGDEDEERHESIDGVEVGELDVKDGNREEKGSQKCDPAAE